ncbi:MAG: hypothetical protein WCF25_09005 [Acidimicrobiales bacterium]
MRELSRTGRSLGARRVLSLALSLGLLAGVLGTVVAPSSSGAATSKDKALFVAVSNSYNGAVSEFNIVLDAFNACSSPGCESAAIEGAGDTRFYKATVALEKKAPYPSGVSKDVIEYVGNLVQIQKDINAVAKSKTFAGQKKLVSGKLEVDVENLAFRGMQILIYLGEQKAY